MTLPDRLADFDARFAAVAKKHGYRRMTAMEFFAYRQKQHMKQIAQEVVRLFELMNPLFDDIPSYEPDADGRGD